MLSSIQVVASIANEASGPSYSVRRLRESLTAAGAGATLAALQRGMNTPKSETHLKVFKDGFGPARLGRSPQMARWLQCAARNADVIHSHGLWMMPNVYAGRAAARAGIPLVISPRGTLSEYAFTSGSRIKPLFWHLLQKHSMHQAVCFHATGITELADIRRMGFEQPVALIPNGVDIPVTGLTPTGGNSEHRILYFGRLHPEKGLATLLAAWARIGPQHPNWHLEIVGPDIDGHRGLLETQARHLNLMRCSFGGPVYGTDKKTALYKSADLYILPSPSENFGMTVAEALACGIPVIATTGTPWQALKDEGAGWQVTPDPDGIASGLEAALTSTTETLQKMGLRGRTWMERDFSWDAIGNQMLQLYAWLVGRGPKPNFIHTGVGYGEGLPYLGHK